MILAILGICIALIVVGVILEHKSDHYDDVGMGLTATGGFLAGLTLIVIIILSWSVGATYRIDKKIELYETQNAQIEKSVAIAVEKYMQYEGDIMTEVSPDSAVTLVAVYPELKSDALIEKQIEIYISNNNEIVKLKEKQIHMPLLKWWLYFGRKGGE